MTDNLDSNTIWEDCHKGGKGGGEGDSFFSHKYFSNSAISQDFVFDFR